MNRGIVGWLLALVLLAPAALRAQQYSVQVVPTQGGGDSLFLDVQIRAETTSFLLGPANFVLDFNSTCLNLAAAGLAPGGAGKWSSADPGYVDLTVTATATRINISILAELATPPTDGLVTTTYQTVARLYVPIQPCSCDLNAVGTFGNAPGVDEYSYNVTLSNVADHSATPVPYPLNTGASSLGSIALGQPPVAGPASISTCATAVQQAYTTATPGYWRLSSTSGSTLLPATFPATSVTINVPPASVTTVDTLYFSTINGSVCETAYPITIQAGPRTDFSLVPSGTGDVCYDDGQGFELILSSSEAGVTYQILQDGSPTGVSLGGTGGPLTFIFGAAYFSSAADTNSSPGYDFTYRATRGGCTLDQPGPGANINVVSCGPSAGAPTPVINQANFGTCGFQDTTLSVVPEVGTSYLWRATGPNASAITFPEGDLGDTVLTRIGNIASGTVVIPVVVTATNSFGTARDTIDITISAAPEPTIDGPTFVFKTGPTASATYQLTSPYNPAHTYVWNISPLADVSTMTSPGGDQFDVTFLGTGTQNYTITLTETNLAGCSTTTAFLSGTEFNILVSNCDANPGNIGPSQTVCLGEGTAVFVDDSLSASGGVIWQKSTTGQLGPYTDVPAGEGIGRRAQVHFTGPITVDTWYRLRAFGSASCENFSQPVLVSVNAQPVATAVEARDTTICENTITRLGFTGGSGNILWQQSVTGFTWQTASGSGILTDSLTLPPLSASTYYRVARYNGCDTAYSNVVYVRVADPPLGSITLPPTWPTSFCVGVPTDTIGVTVSTGSDGFWTSDGAGVFTNDNRYVPDTADAGMTITLSWVVANGSCNPDVSSTAILVDAPSEANIVPPPITLICAGGSTDTLFAETSIGTGIWDDGGAGGEFLPSDSAANVVYVSDTMSAGSVVNLRYTVSNGNCPPTDSIVQITIDPTVIDGEFPPIAPVNRVVCVGDTSVPLGATAGGGATGFWNSSGAGVFTPSPGTGNARYIPAQADAGRTIALTWTVTNGSCTPLVISRNIAVAPLPIANSITDPRSICYTDTLTLFASGSGGSGRWSALAWPTAAPNDTGQGTFIPNRQTANARYVPAAADSNKRFVMTWIVTSPFCGADSSGFDLTISGQPLGTFSTAIPPICAGSSTIPLGATLAEPDIFTGVWRTPNGSGTFSDSLNPNAFYNSDLIGDAGQNIILEWQVISGGCGTAVYSQTVSVDPTVVDGDFTGMGTDGTLLPICFGDSSEVFVNAFANAPSQGVFRTPNGQGQFISLGTGMEDTLNMGMDVVYVPDTADAGERVLIQWVVTNPSNPTCASRIVERALYVADTIDGDFAQPSSICFPSSSNILAGSIVGDSNATGRWVTPDGNGGFVPDATDPNARYFPDAADVGDSVTIWWVVENGICENDTTEHSVRVSGESLINLQVFSPTGTDTICFGDSVTLVASGAEFYNWTPSATLSSSIGDTVVARPTSTTVYTLTASIGNCAFQQQVTIFITPGTPITATSNAGGPICAGEAATLGVAGGDDGSFYAWTLLDGSPINPADISDPTVEMPIVSPSTTTTYRVLARTTNGCFAAGVVTVNVTPNIEPAFPIYDECETSDTSANFVIVPTNLGGLTCSNSIFFSADAATIITSGEPLDSTNSFYIGTGDSIRIVLPTVGSYTYSFFCDNGACQTLTDIQLNVNASPTASFIVPSGVTQVPFNAPTVQFQNTSIGGAILFVWDFGDPASGLLNSSDLPNPVHRFTAPGDYTIVLYIENALGCSDFEVQTSLITVTEESYYFPTAFSPNGDATNQYFRPLPFPIVDDPGTPEDELLTRNQNIINFQVFNRWGVMVYNTDTPDPAWLGWDGTLNGEPLDMGVYTYRIEMVVNGLETTYSGVVNLIR